MPAAFADTPTTSATTSLVDAPAETVSGLDRLPPSANPPAATFNFGTGSDIQLDTVTLVGGTTFARAATDPVVTLRRVPNACTAVERQSMWFGQASQTGQTIDIAGRRLTSQAEALQDPFISNGMDNLFENDPATFTCSNVERMDYLHAPFSVQSTTQDGYFVAERGGNDPATVAVVLAVDGAGAPTVLGPVYEMPASGWGPLGVSLSTAVVQQDPGDPPSLTNLVSQPISGRFLSMSDFGVPIGTTVYGFVMAAGGLASFDLLEYASFPTAQDSALTGIDLAAGFLMTSRERVIGDYVWVDANEDGVQDASEAPLAGVTVSLSDSQRYAAQTTVTDANGFYSFTATPAEYIVAIQIPSGYRLTYDEDSGITSPDGVTVVPAGDLNHLTADFGLTQLVPDVDVAKTAGSVGAVDPSTGEFTVAYTVTVSNTGDGAGSYGPLTDATAFDPAVTALEATWTTSGAGAPPGGTATGDSFTLAPSGTAIAAGATHTFAVTVRVAFAGDQPAAACDGTGTGLFNSASVPTGQETDVTNNDACAEPPAVPQASVLLIKSLSAPPSDTNGDGCIGEGDELSYTFAVTNTGELTLSAVAVADSVVAVTGGPVDGLAPGETDAASFTAGYTITAADVARGGVENSATVSGTPPTGADVGDVSDTGTDPQAATVASPGTVETANPLGVFPNDPADPGDDPTTALIDECAVAPVDPEDPEDPGDPEDPDLAASGLTTPVWPTAGMGAALLGAGVLLTALGAVHGRREAEVVPRAGLEPATDGL